MPSMFIHTVLNAGWKYSNKYTEGGDILRLNSNYTAGIKDILSWDGELRRDHGDQGVHVDEMVRNRRDLGLPALRAHPAGDLLGASLREQDLRAIEAFADQLGLLLDGASLLARTVNIERTLAHAEKLAVIGELTSTARSSLAKAMAVTLSFAASSVARC